MIDLPAEFIRNMQSMLGSQCPAFLHALEQPPALALRLNPLRPGAEAAAAPYVDGPVPWAPHGRYLRPEAGQEGLRPGADIAHWAGAWYLQEASAMAPAAVLDARPGERILDLCAAPGGKATQIAAAMAGRGALVANEPEPARAKVLAGNLERMGAANSAVVNALPGQLARLWPEAFDALLVDAPCSGEGMFRRDPDTRLAWESGAPQGCAKRQSEILESAAALLRPGGRLVYSTCTFNRLENEGVIEGFLARHPEFSPWDFELYGVGSASGGMLRLFPHRLRGDGHFVARLRKEGTLRPGREAPPAKGRRENRQDAAAISALLARLEEEVCALPDFISDMRFFTLGDCLYAAPVQAPALQGVKQVLPGLCLLRAGRSHIEPMHALAMALPEGCARRTVALDSGGAAAYLAGEALPVDAERGWTLITTLGMPLGWGKVVGGTLKNHLPKGLRHTIR